MNAADGTGDGSCALFEAASIGVDDEELFSVRVVQRSRCSPEELARLETETAVLSRLSHPNLLGLVERVDLGDFVFLVSQRCLGGELFDRIAVSEDGRFLEVDAAAVLRQILVGVAFLHANGVAHRDLKPENVIFRTPEKDSALCITDFSLAKPFVDGSLLASHCGTAMFAAPEVLVSEEPYSEKCDLWSVGAIAFVLLTGVYPYDDGLSFAELEQKVALGEWDRAALLEDADISAEAKDFVSSLLVLDPTQRMSAEEALSHPWLANRHL